MHRHVLKHKATAINYKRSTVPLRLTIKTSWSSRHKVSRQLNRKVRLKKLVLLQKKIRQKKRKTNTFYCAKPHLHDWHAQLQKPQTTLCDVTDTTNNEWKFPTALPHTVRQARRLPSWNVLVRPGLESGSWPTSTKADQGRTQGVGVKTPLELDILQKLYCLRKGD